MRVNCCGKMNVSFGNDPRQPRPTTQGPKTEPIRQPRPTTQGPKTEPRS